MKLFVLLLLSLASGGAYGARPEAVEVIDTFKAVAPQYVGFLNQNEKQLQELHRHGSDAIFSFHSNIITLKETFVLSVIKQEDHVRGLIAAQNTSQADELCMKFVEGAANENVNLVGVAYTGCINEADEKLNYTASLYYARIGNLEVALTDFRLLDVFRGDNVFYTPAHIVAKLRNKLSNLNSTLPSLSNGAEEEVQALQDELESIRNEYIECMTKAETSFREYIALAHTQLTVICSAFIEKTTTVAAAPI